MKWYEFDKARAVLEYDKTKSKYPNFTLCRHEDNLAWEGEAHLIPDGISEPPLRIRLIYPDSFPISPIKVYPLYPEIPKEMWSHKWHRWEEGNLCYIQPRLWDMRYTAVDVIEKINIWYFNFLAFKFKLTDKMPDEGIANVPIKGGA